MNIKYFLVALMVMIAAGAQAIDVNVTAGGLREAVGSGSGATSLTVRGEIDASDLEYVRDNMPSLVSLDLGDAVIVSYQGERLSSGIVSSPAGCLAPYSLFGTGVKTIVLPAGLLTIGEGAMGACRALESVKIPSGVTFIGSSAFIDCRSLQSVTFGDKVAEIGSKAFSRCVALKSVILPDAVISIGDCAFKGCHSLVSVTPGKQLEKIGDAAFEDTAVATVNFSGCGKLASVGEFCFASCDNLSEVVLPASVSEIGRGAFFGDCSLGRFVVPASTTLLPDFALTGASDIDASALFHRNVDEIGEYAMYGIDKADKVRLPGSLLYLGSHAMDGWKSLSVIEASSVSTVPELGEDVWGDTDKSRITLYVPEELIAGFETTPQWRDFNIEKGVDGVKAPVAAPSSAVTAEIVDNVLNVVSSSASIETVTVYDFAGNRLLLLKGNGQQVSADVSMLSAPVVIVETVTADRSRHIMKLFRYNN